MHLLTGVRYPLRSVFVQHSDLGTLRKRLLKRAARNVNAIMICILLLAVCMFVRNSLLLDRDSTTFSESPFKTEIFYRVPEFNTSSLKAPSDSLGFQELMENTDDGWLRYYQDRRDELSGMSPMQIMCAYRCWNDWRCLGFVFREALWHMCNLIRYTQTRCYEPPDDIEQPEVSFDSVKLIVAQNGLMECSKIMGC